MVLEAGVGVDNQNWALISTLAYSLSPPLGAIFGDVGDHGMPHLSASSFLNQLHFRFLPLPLFPSIFSVNARCFQTIFSNHMP